MKTNELLSVLAYFFNDIVGTAVPGLIFFVFFVSIHPALWGFVAKPPIEGGWAVGIVIAMSYAMGHVMTSLYDVVESTHSKIWKKIKGGERKGEQTEFPSGQTLFRELAIKKIVVQVGNEKRVIAEQLSPNELRNVALTVSPLAGDLARRFRFLALFCQGTGTSILSIAAYSIAAFFCMPRDWLIFAGSCKWLMIYVVMSLLFAALLYLKGSFFRRTSWNAPFVVALAEATKSEASEDAD